MSTAKAMIAGALLGAVVFAGVLPAMAQTGGSPAAVAEDSARAVITAWKVKQLARAEINKALGATGVITVAIAAGNVDKVDGFDANDIVRADYSATDDVDDSFVNTDGYALAKTITAPVDGMLLAWASVEGQDTGGSISFDCSLQYVINGATGTMAGSERTLYAPSGGHHSCATSGGVTVNAGTYNIRLAISNFSSASQELKGASLQVMFVPFDGTGDVP